MEPLVDTVIEDDRWEALGLETLAGRAVAATLTGLGLPPTGFQIVVMGCDDARIATLNADFRGKPAPTNVLSWPSEERAPDAPGLTPELPEPGSADDPEPLGDIALAYETCAAEATAQGKAMADHVTHLTVHGILHLLGYDHQTDADATLMEGIEQRILATLGVADPY
jgi:probable rRNA maturation factor